MDKLKEYLESEDAEELEGLLNKPENTDIRQLVSCLISNVLDSHSDKAYSKGYEAGYEKGYDDGVRGL